MQSWRVNKRAMIISLMLILMMFQNPLEEVIPFFSIYEELLALAGLGLIFIEIIQSKKMNKYFLLAFILFFVFVIVTLASNFTYGFQSIKAVIIDLFTNVKFLGVFALGIFIALHMDFESFIDIASKCAKWASIFLMIATIIEVLYTNLFSNVDKYSIYGSLMKYIRPATQYLYQAKKLKLFYAHGTYLGATLIFMLIVFTLAGYKQYKLNIMICIVLLIMTGRSKAIAAVGIYLFLWIVCEKMHKVVAVKELLIIGCLALLIGWTKIDYFYGVLGGMSARSILTITSLQIAKDFFPFGTGFGTYASDQAVKNYSRVYRMYGLDQIAETSPDSKFLNDVMWPIIIGQSGVLGTLCYAAVIIMLLVMCIKIQKENRLQSGMWAPLLGFFYLIISSFGEPTFVNVVSMPIAFVLGAMCSWKIIRKKDDCMERD